MKKFVKVLLVTFLVVSMLTALVSCTKTEDASDIYTEAKKKTDSLESFNAIMTIERDFGDESNKFNDKSTVSVKVDQSDKEAPVYLNEYRIEHSGKDVNTTEESSTYYADSVVYQKAADGSKYKQISTAEAVTSQFSTVAIDIPEKAFEKSHVYKNDGLTQVVAEPEAEVVHELLESFISGMETYFTPVNSENGFSFEYSTVSLGLDINSENYFEKMSVEFKAAFEHADGKSAVDMKITVSFIDPGKTPVIEEPEDLAEYIWYEDVEKTEDELQEEFMNEVLALYDENNNPVPEYDELYLELCAKYGKESVDMIVETFEMLKATQG